MLLFFFIFIKLILPKAEVYKIDYNYKKYNQDKDMPWKCDIRDVYCYFEIFLNVWQIVQQCRQDTCAFKMPSNQSTSVEYLNYYKCNLPPSPPSPPPPPALPYWNAIKGDAVLSSSYKTVLHYATQGLPVLSAWLGGKKSQLSSWCNFCVSRKGSLHYQ